ncbi:2'-5' RNA ligase family protein [Kineococcus endophyticus]|uniref:2'-5' RNA ligase family protein n=1 Tax=Kineococcus endophyticus TaxID=1181883 RepID=A0ABV3P379_9ACTN
MEQTALVVEVPAAEAAVAHWRRRHDRAARAGVPAHVTVCFPFLPPHEVDDATEDALAALVTATPAFSLALTRVDGFGDAVLWLAPEPDEPLRALTRAVCATFGLLPYGGAHGGVEDAVPHLTVAEDPPDPAAVRADVAPRLPLTQHVDRLTLLQGSFVPDGWRVRRRFPLGRPTADPR